MVPDNGIDSHRAVLIPLSEKVNNLIDQAVQLLQEAGIPFVVDDRENRTLGKLLASADFYRVPLRVVFSNVDADVSHTERSRSGQTNNPETQVTLDRLLAVANDLSQTRIREALA